MLGMPERARSDVVGVSSCAKPRLVGRRRSSSGERYGFPRRQRGTLGCVSHLARHDPEGPHGTSLLARDLTEEELAAAPVLASVDDLVIEGLTDDEHDSFVAALSS